MPRSANSGKLAHDDFKVKGSLKPLSPKGDLGKHRVEESKLSSRKLRQGAPDIASKYLPNHGAGSMVLDSKYGPGDTV